MTNLFSGAPGASAAAPPVPGAHLQPQVERNLEAARAVVSEMAELLDGLPSTEVAVPRSEWTVGEHGAHIAFANIGFGMFAMGLEYPHGDGTRSGLAEANDVALIGFPERDGSALAAHLRQAMQTFARAVGGAPADQQCPSPLGVMPLGTLTSYFLIHNLMHGCAISAGLNRDFPFRPGHLELVWPLLFAKLPSFVDPAVARGVSGRARVRVRGGFEAVFVMDGSDLELPSSTTGPVDCEVEAEPLHFFLVMIKLLSVNEAVQLGQMSVSGSDPELFSRIMNAIDVP